MVEVVKGQRGLQSNRKSIAVMALAASLGCSSQVSYAGVGLADKLIKTPGAADTDNSLRTLREAWNEVQGDSEVKSLLNESRNSLSIAKRESSDLLSTTKFQHYYNGVEVIGSMAFHQVGRNGSGILNRLAKFDLDTNARIDENTAVAIAKGLAGDRELSSKPELKILPEAEGNGARLTYWIELDASQKDGEREVVVDANTGDIIANLSRHLEIAPINVYSAKDQGVSITENISQDPYSGQPTLSGCTIKDLATGQERQISSDECEKLGPTDLPPRLCQVILDNAPALIDPQYCKQQVVKSSPVGGADPSAIRAAQNSQAVLSYYMTHHKRNSFDNKGTTTVSVVHGGLGFDNAFWNTKQNIMVYGDGDGKMFGDFTAALDVAGHEMTHGVVAYTAKLLGMGESGALNEAYADFFGKMIANDNDWAIGRKLFLNPSDAKGVRDLANPSNLTYCSKKLNGKCTERKPFPDNITKKEAAVGRCDSSNDNCWVHINATIPGHASYLIVQAIGPQKAETLYYQTLTQSLSARDNIETAAAATKQTCHKIFDSSTCSQVEQAFGEVGLGM